MTVEIKPFSETTFADAAKVVESGFGAGAIAQLHKIVRNPIRDKDESAGDIVYEDGKPIAFQAAIKRAYCVGHEKFFATIPGMLVRVPGASPANVLSLIERTLSNRFERKMVVANTAVPVTEKLFALLGVKGKGPASYGNIHFAVLRPGSFLRFCSHNRLPKLLASLIDAPVVLARFLMHSRGIELWQEIRPLELNDFWQRYLKSNVGVVASRTADELKWIFSDAARDGSVLFGVLRNAASGIEGYIAIKESSSCPGRWMVVDWIAVDNDKRTLSVLLRGIKAALRKCRPHAFLLESIGFPDCVADVVHRSLHWSRKSKNNCCVYQVYDDKIKAAIDADRGWFFGPMDGDRCLS